VGHAGSNKLLEFIFRRFCARFQLGRQAAQIRLRFLTQWALLRRTPANDFSPYDNISIILFLQDTHNSQYSFGQNCATAILNNKRALEYRTADAGPSSSTTSSDEMKKAVK
jgi:hypothetical protein